MIEVEMWITQDSERLATVEFTIFEKISVEFLVEHVLVQLSQSGWLESECSSFRDQLRAALIPDWNNLPNHNSRPSGLILKKVVMVNVDSEGNVRIVSCRPMSVE